MNRLFNVAVLWHPTEKQIKDEGKKSEILVAPKTILAKDVETARMTAAMEIPTERRSEIDQIEVAVGPF